VALPSRGSLGRIRFSGFNLILRRSAMQKTEQTPTAKEIETEKFEFEMIDLGPSYKASEEGEIGTCVCMCGSCFCSCVGTSA
jgi:hypothetical protein